MKSEDTKFLVVDRRVVPGRPNWVTVVFEDRDSLTVPIGVWTDFSLAVGRYVNLQELAELENCIVVAEAKERALDYLRYRPRTSVEVSRYLRRKGIADEVAEAAVEQLQRAGWLDDVEYARAFHEAKQQVWSRAQIRFRLRERGVGDDRTAAVVDSDEARAAELAAARRVAARRWSSQTTADARKALLRLAGYLQQKGFPADVVRTVTAEIVQENAGNVVDQAES